MHKQLLASPCIRNCCLNEVDICLGCYRSLVEITQWGPASDAHKASILAAAISRKTIAQHNKPLVQNKNRDTINARR
jgi:uncharacterized protein